LFIQDTDEATAKQREVVEAAEEAVKEAVAATVPSKETTHDDQVKAPQESMQNGATHTTVTKSSDEDANGTGQVLKENQNTILLQNLLISVNFSSLGSCCWFCLLLIF
jgi:restriction endonuclease Mrr